MIVVLIMFAFLEFRIWDYINSDKTIGELQTTLFIWAISPVAAVTAITIFFLVAVFRGFRGNEMDGSGNAVGKIARYGNDPMGES